MKMGGTTDGIGGRLKPGMARTLRITLALLALAVLASPAAAAFKVELQAQVTVAGDVVRLSDVAIVEGDGVGSLQGLVICPAPATGESLAVSRARLSRRLMAQLGSADFTLAGPEECLVTRGAAAAPQGPTNSTNQPRRQATNAGDQMAGPATTARGPVTVSSAQSGGQTLQEAVAAYVLSRFNRPTDKVRLEFEPRDAADLALTDDGAELRISFAGAEMTAGPLSLRADFCARGPWPQKVLRTVYVRLRAVFLEDVVVAARDLAAGEVLTAADVTLERREFRSGDMTAVLSLADAADSTLRSAVRRGEALSPQDLAKTLLVRRGEVVTVRVVGRGFMMKTNSRALESGEAGAVVAVQSLDGDGKFYARVVASRTVELTMTDAEAHAGKTAAAK